jgi:hypothetical protein
MTRFVFCGAADGRVEVSVDQQPVGSASTAEELAGIFMQNGIAAGESIYCSSSIDFCEEEGFEPGAAGEMIESALDCFGDKVVDFYGS